MTDTESADVLKKRNASLGTTSRIPRELAPVEVTGPTRSIHVSLKAEQMVDNILKTLSTNTAKHDAAESLLGVLCQLIKGSYAVFVLPSVDFDGVSFSGESFDTILTAAAATDKLPSLVSSIIKFNQQSQESQGESVKNSLIRAALFDVTLIMLVHIVYCFGKEVRKISCAVFFSGHIKNVFF